VGRSSAYPNTDHPFTSVRISDYSGICVPPFAPPGADRVPRSAAAPCTHPLASGPRAGNCDAAAVCPDVARSSDSNSRLGGHPGGQDLENPKHAARFGPVFAQTTLFGVLNRTADMWSAAIASFRRHPELVRGNLAEVRRRKLKKDSPSLFWRRPLFVLPRAPPLPMPSALPADTGP